MKIIRTKKAEEDIKEIYKYSFLNFAKAQDDIIIIRILHQRMNEIRHLG